MENMGPGWATNNLPWVALLSALAEGDTAV